MLRILFYAIPVVLAIYAIVDCLQTPDDQLRGLPRFGWLVLILIFPLIGSVVWLFAGRQPGGARRPRIARPGLPNSGATGQPRPTRRVVAPDDDPEFLQQLGRKNTAKGNSEQEALLDQWERDLRRREDDLRPGSPGTGPAGPASGSAPGDGPADDAGPEAAGPAPRR